MSNDIKQDLIQSMAKDPEASMRLANYLRQKGKPVPENVLKSLTQESIMGGTFARIIAQTYVQDEEVIPEVLINRIVMNPKDAYYLAKYCVDHDYRIPSPVFDSVEKSQFLGPLQSYIRQNRRDEDEETNEKPSIYKELLSNVMKNPNQAYRYADLLLKNNRPIPSDFEMVFQKNPDEAVRYAVLLMSYDKQPSKNLLNIISKDIDASRTFATLLAGLPKVGIAPEPIINSLAKNAHHASEYAVGLMSKGHAPTEILKKMEHGIINAKETESGVWGNVKRDRSDYASNYAVAYVKLSGELPSKPLMDLVDPRSLVLVCNYLWRNNKIVPPEIVEKISKSPSASFAFKVRYNSLMNKPLPKIYKKIEVVANKYDREHI